MNIQEFRKRYFGAQQRKIDLLETTAGPGVMNGKFRVNGSGEAEKEIFFTGAFGSAPNFSATYEILEEDYVPGDNPHVNIAVSAWVTEDRPPFSRFYRGAKLAVISTGPPNMKFIVHWQATGVIFQEPLS